jgi:hypothetical protein
MSFFSKKDIVDQTQIEINALTESIRVLTIDECDLAGGMVTGIADGILSR